VYLKAAVTFLTVSPRKLLDIRGIPSRLDKFSSVSEVLNRTVDNIILEKTWSWATKLETAELQVGPDM